MNNQIFLEKKEKKKKVPFVAQIQPVSFRFFFLHVFFKKKATVLGHLHQ